MGVIPPRCFLFRLFTLSFSLSLPLSLLLLLTKVGIAFFLQLSGGFLNASITSQLQHTFKGTVEGVQSRFAFTPEAKLIPSSFPAVIEGGHGGLQYGGCPERWRGIALWRKLDFVQWLKNVFGNSWKIKQLLLKAKDEEQVDEAYHRLPPMSRLRLVWAFLAERENLPLEATKRWLKNTLSQTFPQTHREPRPALRIPFSPTIHPRFWRRACPGFSWGLLEPAKQTRSSRLRASSLCLNSRGPSRCPDAYQPGLPVSRIPRAHTP